MYNPDLGTEDFVVVAELESEELLVSTAGKAARSATREKRLRGHPELDVEPWESSLRMSPAAQQMIDHILQLIREPGVSIDENPLVSSGLITPRPSWTCC